MKIITTNCSLEDLKDVNVSIDSKEVCGRSTLLQVGVPTTVGFKGGGIC